MFQNSLKTSLSFIILLQGIYNTYSKVIVACDILICTAYGLRERHSIY